MPVVRRSNWSWQGFRGPAIDTAWPTIWPLLAPCVALDDGRYDETSVKEAIRRGDFQLWLAGAGKYDLAVTTEIRVYPCQKRVNIKYVGGKGLPLAFDFLGTIEAWALTQGCMGVEGYGRAEWARLLKSRGYRISGQGYEKRLVEG